MALYPHFLIWVCIKYMFCITGLHFLLQLALGLVSVQRSSLDTVKSRSEQSNQVLIQTYVHMQLIIIDWKLLSYFVVHSGSDLRKGLSKTELTNTDIYKPLFPNDSSEENVTMVNDPAALGDEADGTSSKLKDVPLADEVIPTKAKKARRH